MVAKIWSFHLNHSAADSHITGGSVEETVVRSLSTIVPTLPIELNLSRVLVGGCFDVLHFGHIKFLQAAKALGNFLSVALEPDAKIVQNKNRHPIHTQQQRAEILSHLRSVDEIILLPFLNNYAEYLSIVQTLQPAYLALTAGDPQFANKQKQAHQIGAELVVVTDYIPEFSSSHLIKEKNWL